MYFYHWTTKKRAEKILEEGCIKCNVECHHIKEKSGNGYTEQGYIYLAVEPINAICFANLCNLEDESDELVLFRIKLSEKEVEPDYNEIRDHALDDSIRKQYRDDLDYSMNELKSCRFGHDIPLTNNVSLIMIDEDYDTIQKLVEGVETNLKATSEKYNDVQKEFLNNIKWQSGDRARRKYMEKKWIELKNNSKKEYNEFLKIDRNRGEVFALGASIFFLFAAMALIILSVILVSFKCNGAMWFYLGGVGSVILGSIINKVSTDVLRNKGKIESREHKRRKILEKHTKKILKDTNKQYKKEFFSNILSGTVNKKRKWFVFCIDALINAILIVNGFPGYDDIKEYPLLVMIVLFIIILALTILMNTVIENFEKTLETDPFQEQFIRDYIIQELI